MRFRPTLPWVFAFVLALFALLPIACSGGSGNSTSSTGTSSGGAGSGTGSSQGGGCSGFCGTGGGAGSLAIVPPTATITVVDGVAMPVALSAQEGGQMVNATWQVDLSAVAGVDGTGNVTATGNVGGSVTVTAKADGQTATALVDVVLKRTVNVSNISTGDQGILSTASAPDGSIVWAYPYDKTVFPKGLLAPEMMWNGGGAADEYRVHFTGKYIDFTFFTTAAPPSRFTPDATSWTQLTESGPGGKVAVEVDRLVPGQPSATKLIDHAWTIANGSMKGTVYYWSNNLGRVLRIKPGATAPEDFLAAAGITSPCSTCHAVSANGSTMIIGGDVSTSTFDLLTNTSVFSTTSVGKPVRNWSMPAVSPDGAVLIENNAPLPGPPGGSDGLWDTHTGQHLTGLGLDGVMLDMPAFSPDGKKIAFVNHSDKSLGVYDFDATTHMVTNPVKLVDQGSTPIAFPSVSPDSKSIVYHRGSLDTRNGAGDLYIASVGQPGSETRLAALNGDNYPFAAGARDLSFNYEPTFAPLDSGGYAWVVFTSRRTYGNKLTGDKTVVKQLWVAAIDQNVTPGTDPSHPAFHLTGQDEATLNMRGFWSLDPCKQAGATCGSGSECCNQNCDAGVCKDPNPNGCSDNGSSCMSASDCCDKAAECINFVCSAPPPQ